MSVPRISREELKARLDSADSSSHPVIIDVRLKYPYEHSTVLLPGAQHVLPDAIATVSLPRDRDIVVYDSDPNDMVSSQAAAELVRRGHRAFVLQGGIAEWMNAKLPVATKSAPQPAAPAAKAAAPAAAAKPGAAAAPRPAPPAASPAAAAASKSAAPASVEGPATPARSTPEKKDEPAGS
jgi:rhodanese-related sulfurtransferase